ncbi:uncharacterized protein LOC141619412 [Silene latifolia]|uniref:uncharacterized protein LOC141619412 n=1 Tax=Silene latifolia TaxID=37657 RepID=UPI003D76A9DE
MVNRIRSIGAKKLSYAGRVVLINSVLNTLYSYWAGMFIIPKGDKVTLPKDEGGLGIKKAELYNITVVAKLVDWVYNKADKLWIKWISQVYLKQQDWHTYTPAAGVAWSWKSICKVKEMMKSGYQNGHWAANLKGVLTSRPNYFSLAAVLTTDVASVIRNLKLWSILDAYTSSGRSAGARLKLNTHYLLWSACFYHIWNQRNNSRVNMILTRPASLAMQIREDAMRRIRSKIGRTVVNHERTWLQKWGIVV